MIGALLGTRSEDGSEVEVRSSFAVPHSEAAEQVTVDVDYYKRMQILHSKVNPQEVLLGWYATSHELDTFSPLIHNFFSDKGDGTWPHPAIHMTVSTEPGKPIDTRTYISAPLWVKADFSEERALFVPVPHEVRYNEAEKNGMDALSVANNNEDRVASLFTDMELLEKSICEVIDMIDRVSKYVEAVLDEEAPVSAALGQFLLNALAVAPYTEFEENLFVHPFAAVLERSVLWLTLTSPAATITYKTSLLSPTSAIRSARKWNSQTGLRQVRRLNSGMKCMRIIILQMFPSNVNEHAPLEYSRHKGLVSGFPGTYPLLRAVSNKTEQTPTWNWPFFSFLSISSGLRAFL